MNENELYIYLFDGQLKMKNEQNRMREGRIFNNFVLFVEWTNFGWWNI